MTPIRTSIRTAANRPRLRGVTGSLAITTGSGGGGSTSVHADSYVPTS